MRFIYTALILILSFLLYATNAQTSTFAGTYKHTIGQESSHSINYTLKLNIDGTFTFHSFSNDVKGIPPEVHTYGKGQWEANKNIISFSTGMNDDINEKYSLDFNSTKARYITKSPRDNSNRVIKTRLQIYNSEIRFLHGTELIKE